MPRFNIDFVGKRKIFLTLSLILILLSVAVSFLGVEVAIEFKGGTIITYEFTTDDPEGELDTANLDSVLANRINSSYNVQYGNSFGDEGGRTMSLSFSGGGTYNADDGTYTATGENFTAAQQSEMTESLVSAFPDSNLTLVDSSNVNPTAGRTFFLKCITAVALASILLILYISLRFKAISGWYAGVCAILALIHDVVIAYGFFIALGFEIDSNFMAVILTLLGYSINDTIVIYDRLRENQKLNRKMPLIDLTNRSINQSLTRSINTGIAATVPMIIVTVVCLLSGVTSILSLTIPLAIGMIVGTYSSLCVAPSLWVMREAAGELKAVKSEQPAAATE